MTKLSLSAVLTQTIGLDSIKSGSKWGQLLRAEGVARSGEFRRIEDLARRDWQKDPSLASATAELTAFLRLPNGGEPCSKDCRCPRELWPAQAAALIEAATVHGVFGPIPVGNGKALISILAPLVMGAKRPVLFVPAQLRDQTNRFVLPMLRKHWRLPSALKVVGYSELSLAKNKNLLHTLAPDLIVLDEAHSAKNPQAARTKRFREYLKAAPETRVIALSGTMTRRSLLDYWQLLLWTHKPDLSPLPSTWNEVSSWADALDEGVEVPAPPGALVRLCAGEETPREGFRRRLVETPGVIALSAKELGCSLVIRERKIEAPAHVRAQMEKMRKTWETPNGDQIVEAVELWRHMRELALGFVYRWDPTAPQDWLEARSNWKRYVREVLKHNRRGLDSELLVTNECSRAKSPPKEWSAWQEIKASFEINTVPDWLDPFALRAATDWMSTEESGIVWVEHVAFGERLAKDSGLPYFGAGMKASAAIADASGPIIASISAHGQGKNLQRWARNLFVAPPSSGKTWEQVLGRTHRHGQEADEVTNDVWLHAEELRASFTQARADARYIEQTLGTRQKLCYASVTIEP